MRSHLRKGIFITFEGGEGAGKTTLIEGIVKELSSQGLSLLKTREPGGTRLGEEIRNILLHHTHEGAPLSPQAELSLFLASRAQHVQEVIRPALEAKKVVLCDRFNDSSIAYQGMARGLGMEKVEAFCQFISENLQPDLTLYLDVDPEIGLSRTKGREKQDRIESEKGDFHRKIREGYLLIQKKHPKRFHLLDATLPPEKVYENAMRWISPLFEEARSC